MRIVDQEHERVGLWIGEKNGFKWREGDKCIGLEKDGQLIAGVMYEGWNGASIHAHIAIQGRINREFLWYIFYYPFVQAGVNVIIGLVSEDNKKAQAFDEHLGFTLHSRLPKGHPSGDLLIYTMTKDQCKWLNIKRNTNGYTV